MKILVIGATGKTGHEVVRQAIEAGEQVTAFVRDPARLRIHDPGLSVVEGDVTNPGDLRRALQGQDAVISTLGARARNTVAGPFRRSRDDSLMQKSTAALIAAADEARVRRVVVLSTFMLAPNFRAGMLKPLELYYKGMNDDKRAAEELLRRSHLDWTIVWATRLTDGDGSGSARLVPVTETVSPRNSISRSDVAAFLLAQVRSQETIRRDAVCTGN